MFPHGVCMRDLVLRYPIVILLPISRLRGSHRAAPLFVQREEPALAAWQLVLCALGLTSVLFMRAVRAVGSVTDPLDCRFSCVRQVWTDSCAFTYLRLRCTTFRVACARTAPYTRQDRSQLSACRVTDHNPAPSRVSPLFTAHSSTGYSFCLQEVLRVSGTKSASASWGAADEDIDKRTAQETRILINTELLSVVLA